MKPSASISRFVENINFSVDEMSNMPPEGGLINVYVPLTREELNAEGTENIRMMRKLGAIHADQIRFNGKRVDYAEKSIRIPCIIKSYGHVLSFDAIGTRIRKRAKKVLVNAKLYYGYKRWIEIHLVKFIKYRGQAYRYGLLHDIKRAIYYERLAEQELELHDIRPKYVEMERRYRRRKLKRSPRPVSIRQPLFKALMSEAVCEGTVILEKDVASGSTDILDEMIALAGDFVVLFGRRESEEESCEVNIKAGSGRYIVIPKKVEEKLERLEQYYREKGKDVTRTKLMRLFIFIMFILQCIQHIPLIIQRAIQLRLEKGQAMAVVLACSGREERNFMWIMLKKLGFGS